MARQVAYKTRGLDLSGTLEGAGGIGGLLARYRHGTSSPYAINGASFYHADGNGNVTYLANSGGGADAAYRYAPFGRWLAGTGPYATANGLRFSSKPWIAHNGSNTDGLYYYYGYRFYDPNLQRWPNRDPLGEAGGLNLYGFVGNNPLTRFDALGLQWPGYPDWPQKPPPKPPKYPKGFALCQRNIQKDGSCDCPAISPMQSGESTPTCSTSMTTATNGGMALESRELHRKNTLIPTVANRARRPGAH